MTPLSASDRTILELRLRIAFGSEARVLLSRLRAVLDAARPTHAAIVRALIELLSECAEPAPPEFRQWVVESVTEALIGAEG
jgi:hypothetical protein